MVGGNRNVPPSRCVQTAARQLAAAQYFHHRGTAAAQCAPHCTCKFRWAPPALGEERLLERVARPGAPRYSRELVPQARVSVPQLTPELAELRRRVVPQIGTVLFDATVDRLRELDERRLDALRDVPRLEKLFPQPRCTVDERIAQLPDEAQLRCGSAKSATDRQAALIVFGKRGNLDLVVAINRAADELGLSPGIALAQARAMHPALIAVPEDQAADARLLETIAEWCHKQRGGLRL